MPCPLKKCIVQGMPGVSSPVAHRSPGNMTTGTLNREDKMAIKPSRTRTVPRSLLVLAVGLAFLLGGCSSVSEQGQQGLSPAIGGPRPADSSGGPLPRLPRLDETAALDDYVTYALLNNPGLRASYDRWIAAIQKVPQARSLPNPSLGYSYFIDSIETRVGPQRHRFELMQMIPFFGKLGLRGERALAAANAARSRYEQERLSLLYRVKEAYYEYYYLGRAIQITEENVTLLTRLERVASQQVRSGAAQQDMLKAQVELGTLTDRLASLRDMRGAVAARLNAELNRPIDTPLPWPKEVTEQEIRASEQEIFQLARSGNWELQALSFEVERNRKHVALARREFYPDFGLGVGYIATGEAGGSMSPPDSGKDAVAAMVSLSLPVWRRRLHAGLQEARATLAAAIEARQQKENTLLSQVRFALYKYNDAVRQMRLYGDTLIPKSRQALESSEAGYRAGEVDFVNIIDGERQLLAFRLARERALAEHQQRLAELETLVGRPLSGLSEEEQQPSTSGHSDLPASADVE